MKTDLMICLGVNVLMLMLATAMTLGILMGVGVERLCVGGFALLTIVCIKQELALQMNRRRVKSLMTLLENNAVIIKGGLK